MGYNILERKLAKIVGAKNVKQAEPLRDHCAYGIGGNAKYFVCPPDFVSLIKVLNLAKTQKVKCKIIGNGTNLLFADEGYDGIIICTKQISSYQLVDKSSILVTSGTTIGALLNICQRSGLSGLEFMAGIPGTVGGAVIMNAGAFGGEIAERIKMVGYFENGELKTIKAEEVPFGYRTSGGFFDGKVVAYVELGLDPAEPSTILEKIQKVASSRAELQPYGKCAGSVFKKCDGLSAGKLIDDAGLKGLKFGGAEISTVHANFFMNINGAKATDVLMLVDIASKVVKEKFDKILELEIEIVE